LCQTSVPTKPILSGAASLAACERGEAVVRHADLRSVDAKPFEFAPDRWRWSDEEIDRVEDLPCARQSGVDVRSRRCEPCRPRHAARERLGQRPHAPGEGGNGPHGDARRMRPRAQRAERHLVVKRRLAEAAHTPFGIDDRADVSLLAMKSLPARWTYQAVVMQRGDDGGTAAARQGRQIERQVQQVVDMNDVGLNGAQHVLETPIDDRRSIGFLERGDGPVIDQLDDRQPVVHAPADLAVRAPAVEVGAERRDVMPLGLLPTQLEGINLRTGAMTRQEVMDRVKNAQGAIIPCNLLKT
jgi:hypothetical protein